VYTNAGINVLFFQDLTADLTRLVDVSEKTRKLNPKKLEKEIKREKKRIATKQKSTVQLIKNWATGAGRPENGSFVGFNMLNKRGSVCMPKYY